MKSFIQSFFYLISVLVSTVRFIPHLIAFVFSKNKKIIREDLQRYGLVKRFSSYKNTILLFLALLSGDRYFRKLFYHRVGGISKMFSWIAPGERTLYFCTSTIKGGLYVPHAYSTIIHAKKIGCNCTIHQCTTIGNKYEGNNEDLPIIGDNVTVGANCVIIGPVNVGNNVVIGAGTVVVKNIPDDSVAYGNPMIIKKNRI